MNMEILDILTPKPLETPHPNMVTEIGELVQLVNSEGELIPDIGIVVEQSAHDADLWRVEWTNSDHEWEGYACGEVYHAWFETGDLWVISKK